MLLSPLKKLLRDVAQVRLSVIVTSFMLGVVVFPPGPHEAQTPSTVWKDLRAHNLQPSYATATDTLPTFLTSKVGPDIVEAKGWTKDSQGRIYLTANIPQPTQSPQPIATC
ncbi:hypothetical protein HRE53_21400 [Acaryochloris sp. 'Moss Beach']|uniref:hypothetical protein n=1 Tax=Acaryochloris sp. 'Moss Beach' TaxID=2740837 RepID=UPI001F3C7B03|nr:hypothetical protein [Acaryochloris sp. 'Moss Beach']UJB68962.1 hypothetical protein HRE53_21400 [Acaryochloris sp. 'Moss Beach']